MADEKINIQDTAAEFDTDLIKALADLGITKEDIEKAKKPDTEKKEEGSEKKEEAAEKKEEQAEKKEEKEEDEDSEEDLEKAYSKAKAEVDEMEKSMAGKKAALAGLEAKRKPIQKAEADDLNKGTELIKALTDQLQDLKKGIDDLKSENSELRKSIDTIGAAPQGMKSVTKHSFIEKAEKLEDEGGRTVLSVTTQKPLVEAEIEKAMDDESNDNIKKALADTLLAYNAGGAPISNEIAKYLYDNKNVRLVK
jgi:predicted RNase H-like nuclease (RuvC/YqgF family)